LSASESIVVAWILTSGAAWDDPASLRQFRAIRQIWSCRPGRSGSSP